MRLLLTLSFLILLGACNKDANFLNEDLTPPRQERDNRYVIGELARASSVDVVFVIDNSGSMGWIQDNIVQNAAIFMEEFMRISLVEWKMGIISTDNSDTVREITQYLGFQSPFNRRTPNVIDTFQGTQDSTVRLADIKITTYPHGQSSSMVDDPFGIQGKSVPTTIIDAKFSTLYIHW